MIAKLFIIIVIVLILMVVYMNIDRSKEGIIKREANKDQFKKSLNENVLTPLSRTVEGRVSQDKIKKTKERYAHAGIHISYTGTLFLCFFVGAALGIAILIGLNNPFMALVAFGAGWNIPSMVIGFLVNKRLDKLDEQIGMFMRMTTERFKVTNNFYQSMLTTVNDMAGEEPVHTELVRMISEIESGFAITDAMHSLADRIGNKYMRRFADYYEITAEIGTPEAREGVLEQALAQYQHHIKTTRELKKQISEATSEAYIMLAFVPLVVVYNIGQDPTYIPFMTTTLLGKVGSAVMVTVWLVCFWMINSKLGAPIEEA